MLQQIFIAALPCDLPTEIKRTTLVSSVKFRPMRRVATAS
jgi:hypothetical protein